MSNTIKLLAIDTATDACSVALNLAGQIVEKFEIIPRAHTRILLPMINDLLKEAGITLDELDVFAFGEGPGSFTGIRIACSVIQALSFGLNKPVVPVSTLRVLAQGAARTSGATQVMAILDARMGSFYQESFELNTAGIMQPVTEEHPDWQQVTGYPHAQDIARIAEFEYNQGNAIPAELALPVYEGVRSGHRQNF